MSLTNREIETSTFLLGCGSLYLGILPAGTNPESATPTTIDSALVHVGEIEKSCKLMIDRQTTDIKSVNGLVDRLPTNTKVEMSTGVLTWDIARLNELLGANVTTDGAGVKKTVGGNNDKIPTVYLRFVHNKKSGGTITVNIYRAKSDGKLDLDFTADKAITTDYKFTGLVGSSGNFYEIIETFPEE